MWLYMSWSGYADIKIAEQIVLALTGHIHVTGLHAKVQSKRSVIYGGEVVFL